MKIAFFHNLPTGGAKRVVYEQIKFLSQKHEIDLYEIETQEQALFESKQLTKNNYSYSFQISTQSGIRGRIIKDYRNFVTLKSLQKKIAQQIDNQKYDLVIVHPDKFTQTPFILRFLKTTTIYFCEEWLRIIYEPEYAFTENVSVLKKLYENITRKVRKNIDYTNMQCAQTIVANSSFTAQNIQKAYGKNAQVALLGVDTDFYHPLNSKKQSDILFIGEKVNQEGYYLLEKAQKQIKTKVTILSRKNNKFSLTDQDMIKAYNNAKIVLALSFNEPFGLIPLEAMACGVPVIALNEGGYTETIHDAKTGFLIPRDSKILAEKINYLLQNESLRQELGRNGRKSMEKNFTWQKHGQRLEKIIKQCQK
jgi:glycosyltransferase involved in cell wall biosynthesis